MEGSKVETLPGSIFYEASEGGVDRIGSRFIYGYHAKKSPIECPDLFGATLLGMMDAS